MIVIYDMVRGGDIVAQVVTLGSGKCVVSWPTSVIVYDSEAAARAVHITHMGGCGESTKFRFSWASNPCFMRAVHDCWQDASENAPFGSVGGLKGRQKLVAPPYQTLKDPAAYVAGYEAAAAEMFGPDWRTCEFSWGKALEIGGDAAGHRVVDQPKVCDHGQ